MAYQWEVKEGLTGSTLVQPISNSGDVAIVPDPTYPIHYQAFILAGANVENGTGANI